MTTESEPSATDLLNNAAHAPTVVVGVARSDAGDEKNMLFSSDGIHWANVATSSIEKLEKISKIRVESSLHDLVRLQLKPADSVHAETYANLLRTAALKRPDASIIWDPPTWDPRGGMK